MVKQAAGARPTFHVTAPVGWINDPNGFSWYGEKYHLFCQYHPYSTQWGPMHWAHYRTEDMVRWELLPCAMAPDEAYDAGGCFSGSALETEAGHVLMYTAVMLETDADGRSRMRQQQAIAIGDGETYHKLADNPVITSDMLPEGCSREDFRDPKIWKENDRYYALMANRSVTGEGQALLYASEDLEHWSFVSVFDHSGGQYGGMWECPDFFPLDGEEVLMVSPQFMEAQGLEFHNGNNSVVFAGKRDPEGKHFIRKTPEQIDYGTDFYAPQTTCAPDGRRILIGWMQNWENRMYPDDFGWCGMMTVPRELSMQDGHLIQTPIRELLQYRTDKAEHRGNLCSADGWQEWDGICGRCLDLTVSLTTADCNVFRMKLASDGSGRETLLILNLKKGILTLDRTYSGMKLDLITARSMYVDTAKEQIELRILMDAYSIEVFANGGRNVMSMVIFTPPGADRIAFSCEGATDVAVEKFDIKV